MKQALADRVQTGPVSKHGNGMLTESWDALGGDVAAAVTTEYGPERVLPSGFDVTALAAASVGAATLAAAQVWAARTGAPVAAVSVDRRAAALSFASETLFQPIGWSTPPIWDPIAGDYEAADGWIRLHTNYRHHRDGVHRVLGPLSDPAAVAAAVADWPATRLETAVVEAGGCAAAMHDRVAWLTTPAGTAAAAEPLARWDTRPARAPADLLRAGPSGPDRPYTGLRVLDLTRVLAGPVATRFLAAYGADVLRIDPPGFADVPAATPETTAGKHCASLDLHQPVDRATFERLIATAHVFVSGLRADALARLGYDGTALRALNPALITARHNAYGWTGPWQHRRGFDSLVQMSCGIAAAAGTARPKPLPVQALDHATGYLIAAAVGLGLRRLLVDGVCADVRLSLIGTANLLQRHEVAGGSAQPQPEVTDDDRRDAATAWGPARRIPLPGRLDGVEPQWTVEAGPLGRHPATWSTPVPMEEG